MDRMAVGKQGEDFTCAYLARNGKKILCRNYRAKKGEIDIIVRDGDTVAFVEVKTRTGSAYGTPGEAVTYRKQQMIAQTARWYLAQNKLFDMNARFDVAEVYVRTDGMRMNYIKNAFGI